MPENPTHPKPLPAPPSSSGKHTTMAILMVVMALGAVVFFNYFLSYRRQLSEGRLPMSGRVETDLAAWVDQNGKERHLESLLGKVFVVSYLYTTCPMGCAGVAEEMAKLQEEFGSNPDFQLVSVSLDPEHDRPEVLKAWLDTKGYGGNNWWFLTSPTPEGGDTVRDWMKRTFKIAAVRKDEELIKKNPADVWNHQLVMVLIDAKGNIRTPTATTAYYWPFHEAYDYGWFPRPIREDVAKLLKEVEEDRQLHIGE